MHACRVSYLAAELYVRLRIISWTRFVRLSIIKAAMEPINREDFGAISWSQSRDACHDDDGFLTELEKPRMLQRLLATAWPPLQHIGDQLEPDQISACSGGLPKPK